jgi:hypothetical protein
VDAPPGPLLLGLVIFIENHLKSIVTVDSFTRPTFLVLILGPKSVQSQWGERSLSSRGQQLYADLSLVKTPSALRIVDVRALPGETHGQCLISPSLLRQPCSVP